MHFYSREKQSEILKIPHLDVGIKTSFNQFFRHNTTKRCDQVPIGYRTKYSSVTSLSWWPLDHTTIKFHLILPWACGDISRSPEKLLARFADGWSLWRATRRSSRPWRPQPQRRCCQSRRGASKAAKLGGPEAIAYPWIS